MARFRKGQLVKFQLSEYAGWVEGYGPLDLFLKNGMAVAELDCGLVTRVERPVHDMVDVEILSDGKLMAFRVTDTTCGFSLLQDVPDEKG